MSIELPDLIKKDCLYLSLDCTIELSSEEKDKIEKITAKKIVIFSTYLTGINKIRAVIRAEQRKDNDKLFDFSFSFSNKSEEDASEENKQDIITRILEILVQKNTKSNFNIDALFKYSTDNYESVIPLPLALPLPVKQKVEITGLHLNFVDNNYSQIIDLVGKHIFHNVVVFKEFQLDSNLFINIFGETSQLSRNLLKGKSTKDA